MSTLSANILTIQDLLERWRALGSVRLDDGRELIGEVDCGHWMHAVWAGATERGLDAVAERLGRRVPPRLRAFWSRIGGVSLFSAGFQFASVEADAPGHPMQLQCGGESDAPAWLPHGACILARNAWDDTVHVLEPDGEEVTRRDPATGEVVDRHRDALVMVAERLSRIDGLQMAAAVGTETEGITAR